MESSGNGLPGDLIDPGQKNNALSRAMPLVAADILSFTVTICMALLAAMLTRYYIFGEFRPPVARDITRIFLVFSTAFAILLFKSWALGHYSRFRPFWLELQEVFKIVLTIAAFDAFLLFAIGVQFSRLWFGFFLILLCVFLPYGREKTKWLMIRKGLWFQPTYIVGTGQNARRTADAVESDTSLGHKVIGFIETGHTEPRLLEIRGIPVFSSQDHAREQTGENGTLLFALESAEEMDNQQVLINQTIASSVQVSIVPPRMELPLYGASVVGIFRHDVALLKIQNKLADGNAQLLKRFVDVVFGSLFLVLLSPVFVILAVLIRRDNGPVFYKHKRTGRNGEQFNCLKFRSMAVDSDGLLEQHLMENSEARQDWHTKRKLKHDPRVTKIGRYLRKTSVDELPQLFNVIKGEMSLVGPRPIVEDEKQQYGSLLSYYLLMTPGMTGLWQVSGRTDTSYNERVKLDVWYSRNWTLWNDVVILIKTCKTLIHRHGAY